MHGGPDLSNRASETRDFLGADTTSEHMGEIREERLMQFLEENDTPVLGIREGCMLRVEGDRMELRWRALGLPELRQWRY